MRLLSKFSVKVILSLDIPVARLWIGTPFHGRPYNTSAVIANFIPGSSSKLLIVGNNKYVCDSYALRNVGTYKLPCPRHLRARKPICSKYLRATSIHCRQYAEEKSGNETSDADKKPPSIFKRFKQMSKDYWYVLIPVHIVTSTFWFGSFYYLAKSGVDIASLLEWVGARESFVEKMKNGNSTTGYLAIAYALYKIATPLRYTVTLGGTTISIKYLRDWGYIKPVPPKDKLKAIYREQKDIFIEKKDKIKRIYRERKNSFKNSKSKASRLLRKFRMRKKNS